MSTSRDRAAADDEGCASKSEVLILMLQYLKTNGLRSSYDTLLREASKNFHVTEPPAETRDLEEILSEYLVLHDRHSQALALCKNQMLGPQLTGKMAFALRGFAQLMDDYMIARDHMTDQLESADLNESSSDPFRNIENQSVSNGAFARGPSSTYLGNKKVGGSNLRRMQDNIPSASRDSTTSGRLSDVVGTMSEQLKRRNNKNGMASNHKNLSVKRSSGSFLTPRKMDISDNLGLSNISFGGNVTPIEMDHNLSASRIIGLDEHDLSLADIGNSPSLLGYDGNKTNKSLMGPGEASLGSILLDTNSLLGGNRTSFSFLNDISFQKGVISPTNGSSFPTNKLRDSKISTRADSTDSATTSALAGSPETQRRPSAETATQSTNPSTAPNLKRKRRITPTTIRARSSAVSRNTRTKTASSSQCSRSLITASGVIPDVDNLLDTVHKS